MPQITNIFTRFSFKQLRTKVDLDFMKQFFGAFFGSILGLIIATLLAVFITIFAVKSSFKSSFNDKTELQVKANSILKISLNGEITDREKLNPFKDFSELEGFGGNTGFGLNTLVKKITAAQDDKNIKGIYLEIKNIQAGSATLLELRNALLDFKKSGKFIYVYSENYSQQDYFLASAASKVFLHPQGNLSWKGLSMNLLFFKKTFQKLDIDMQIFRHGKFKSAIEPYLLDKMSQESRYQSEIFLNSIWNTLLTAISEDRKLTKEELNRLANNLEIQFPEDALVKFVDALAYEDEVIAELKEAVGMKPDEKLKFVAFEKYQSKEEKIKADRVAVIYASGAISGGEGSEEEVGSDRLAKTIKEARLDDKIKAIVLRINSPGGSALASDVIWREVLLAKKAKPTVVSMGNVAASGGYYISCAADRIFAQPNTITGSIGVFGVLPNFKKMLENKLGITVDTVNTNKYSDLASGLREMSQKEYNYIQNSVEKVYETFTRRVAEGRNMTQAQVDSIAQGRVWTGTDALKIGLVDELGGLNDAIAYAAQKADLKNYRLVELPKQKNPFDELFGKKESDVETYLLKKNLGTSYKYLKQLQHVLKLEGVQTRLPFEIIMN